MNKEILLKQLAEKQKILASLERKIVLAEKDLEARQETYMNSVLKEEEGQRITGIEVQLERKVTAQGKLEGLKSAQAKIEADIQAIEKDLGLVKLHSDQVDRFHQAMVRCQGAIGILEHAEILSQQIQSMTGAIEALYSEMEVAVGSLAATHSALPSNYSLESFLNGELLTIEPGSEDRDGILEKIGQELKAIARIGINIDLHAIERLGEAMQLLPLWQTRISEFTDGRSIVLTRQSLRPRLPHKTIASSSMLPPDYSDVRKHPKRYSGRDFEGMKRAEGVDEKTNNFGTFMEDTYSGTY